MKDGDVFRWSYKDPKPDWSNVSYWAKSRIGIVKGDFIFDTYWGSSGGNAVWDFKEANSLLNLDFLANMADLEKVDEHRLIYYADADVVNLNHANSSKGNAYIRKGAKRSPEKMLEVVRHNIERANSRIKSLEHDIAQLSEAERAILASEDLDNLHLFEVLP